MSAANETVIDHEALRALQDRTDVADVLYRYSSAVDSFDKEGLRSCLADDIHAQQPMPTAQPPQVPTAREALRFGHRHP